MMNIPVANEINNKSKLTQKKSKGWKILKWISVFFVCLLGIIILTILLIQTTPGKDFVRKNVESFLHTKFKSIVRIGAIDYRLPQWIELKNVYIEDQARKPLLQGQSIYVNLNILRLITGNVQMNKIVLKGVSLQLDRKAENATFNYQFILDAFSLKNKTPNSIPNKKQGFSLNEVILDNVHLLYDDKHNAMFCQAEIGKCSLICKEFNTDSLFFSFRNASVEKTKVTVISGGTKQTNLTAKKTDLALAENRPNSLRIWSNKLIIHDLNISYKDLDKNLWYTNKISASTVSKVEFDLAGKNIVADQIQMTSSEFELTLLSNPVGAMQINESTQIDSSSDWKVNAVGIHLRDNKFKFDDNLYPKNLSTLDPHHLDMKDISMQAQNFAYSKNELKSIIHSGKATFSNSFSLRNIQGDFVYDDSGAVYKHVDIKTNQSIVHINGMFRYNDTKWKRRFNENTLLLASINHSSLSWSELQYLMPSLRKNPPVNLLPNTTISIEGYITGSMKTMQVHSIAIQTSDSTFKLKAKGVLHTINPIQKLKYNVDIATLDVDKNILPYYVQSNLKKNNIQLPNRMQLNGIAAGSINDFNGNIKMMSSYGNATLNGNVKNFSRPKLLLYDLNLTATNLETGKWIGKDSMYGPLTGNIKINGNGTELKIASATTLVDLQSCWLSGVTYHHINLKASIHSGSYLLHGSIADPLINTDMDVHGNFVGQYPTVFGSILLNELNLYEMKMVKDPLNIHSSITLNMMSLQPQTLDIETAMKHTSIITSNRTIQVDSMSVFGKKTNDSTNVTVQSPFLNATLKGRYDYENLMNAVSKFITDKTSKSAYMGLSNSIIPQQADLAMSIQQSELLQSMVPGISFDEPIYITGSFNNEKHDSILKVNSSIPSFTYQNSHLDNLLLHVYGGDTALQLIATADGMIINSNHIYSPELRVGFARNQADAFLKTYDANKKEFYVINGRAIFGNKQTTVSLQNDLILNYSKWNVDPANEIHIFKEGYVANNVILTQGTQLISINSTLKNGLSPLQLSIKNFDLKTIFSFFNKDSTLTGKLNSEVVIQQPIETIPAFDGDMSIQALTYKKIVIGEVGIKASCTQNGIVNLDGALTGPNQVHVGGTINTVNHQLNIESQLTKLDMKSVEAFSDGQLMRSSGDIKGTVAVTGNTNTPEWNGELNFDNVAVVAAMTNSPYKINHQKIGLTYPSILFDKYSIQDSLNHSITIDGSVSLTKSNDIDLNLVFNTRNFVAFNNPQNNHQMVSGTGVVDIDLQVLGNPTSPDINGHVVIKNESDLYIATLQSKDYRAEFRKAIRFIDRDTMSNLQTAFYRPMTDTSKIVFHGLKYNLNLDIEEQATLTMLIDPVTGDKLQVKGIAQLNAGIDENGKLGITGIYNLKNGYYSLTYSVLKRKFDLVDGSTIIFSGDPLQAEANVTANYELEASPRDLLGNEISENSSTLGGAFNSKIPFIVVLKIDGPILKPNITFDIRTKENIAGVNSNLLNAINTKLAQFRSDAAAMNKQVFALLILKKFIGERSNDFFAGVGNSANSTVKQSVSQFLADAVEQISSDLVKGVDISLDVKNYQEEGHKQNDRTDVSLGLSKRLMNDRLSIMVGKSFTVEGDDPVAKTQTNSNLQFLPDLTSTYKLTKDGRYSVKAYRRNQYEAIMDGYFIESGLVFSLSMNYSKMNEFFRKKLAID